MSKLSRVGEKHLQKNFGNCEIIDYTNSSNVVVLFSDGTIVKNVAYGDVKKGTVKNPNFKNILGFGKTGQGTYSKKDNHKFYRVWYSMIERIFSSKSFLYNPSYIKSSVCEDWGNFQNFAEWMEQNYNSETMQGWHLDKDILVKGNKIYSPETCCFVPAEINTLFTKNNIDRGDYPIGVSKFKNRFSSRLLIKNKSVFIGYFATPEEAFQAYKTAKEKYIREVADKWKDQIDPRVYEAMYNYKVEITD